MKRIYKFLVCHIKKRHVAGIIFFIAGFLFLLDAVNNGSFDEKSAKGSAAMIVSILSFNGMIPYDGPYDPGSLSDKFNKWIDRKSPEESGEK